MIEILTMENSALDGAQFNMERFQIYCQEARDAYHKNIKILAFYSFGNAITHHGTVIFCENGLVFAIHIRGNGDQERLYLRAELSKWKPNIGEPVFKVSGIRFCDLYNEAIKCCHEFGKYDASINNCQTWNNKLLKLFKKKRRTIWSWFTSVVLSAIVGVGAFIFLLPPIMASE